MVVAVAMLFSGLIAAFPMASAQAAGAPLAVAQYVKTSGNATYSTDTQSATYNGTVNINVPLSTVMSSFESDMEEAATAGYYPHSKDAANTIAYIEYSVTFPENVAVGTMSYTNNSTIISKVERDPKTRSQVVKLKMYLIDQNWKKIYEAYNNDKQNPSAHTVNIAIPYTVTANSKQQAQQFEAATIAGSGSFEFWASGSWWGVFGKHEYVSDNASQPLATGMSACFPEPIKQESKLPADLQVSVSGSNKFDTTHAKPFEADSKSVKLDVQGVLHVGESVKTQMKAIEKAFKKTGDDFKAISLKNTAFGFDATLTLPEGMAFGDTDVKNLKLEGAPGFHIVAAKTAFDGRTVKVRFELDNPDRIATYADLKKIVDGVADDLKVTVPGVKFEDATKAGGNYIMSGSVQGAFSAQATYNKTDVNFAFT